MGGVLEIRHVGALATGDLRAPVRDDVSSVFVQDGRVAAIGSASDLDAEVEAVLDAAGAFLAPGLWDADHRPYFGDHTPHYDARGYLDRTVLAGTTTLVSSGTRDVPGVSPDARTARALAVLAQRSWRLDRPREVKVLAGTVVATSGLGEADVAELARQGVGRLVFLEPLPTEREARQQADWAHAHGLVVIARWNAQVEAIDLDIALSVNGDPTPPNDRALSWLVERSRCAVVVSLAGNLRLAGQVATRLAERGELDRLLVGTAMPSVVGVLPGGVQRMVQHLVASVPSLGPAVALACASGNTARAFRQMGGVVAEGQPADLIVCRPAAGAPYVDALDALSQGGWLETAAVLIDGEIQHLDEPARVARAESVAWSR